MSNKNKINNISIIPALSNNNHELFHSNLWKWLIDTDSEFVKCFFKKCNTNNKLNIYREKENLDLKIIDKKDNKQYIIENKLKSIPNEEQLEIYKEKQNERSCYKTEYLIVFLIKKQEMKKVEGWEKISYIKLAKKLKEKLKERKNNNSIKKYYEILDEYCNYIINDFGKISRSGYVKKKNYYFGEEEIEPKHIAEGLKVIYQKMKAEKFIYELNKKINVKEYDKKFENKGYTLIHYLGYYHGKPCFTYRIQNKKFGRERAELKKHTAMEIQLEGNQYRHMVRLIKDNKDKAEKINENRQKVYYKRAKVIFDKTDFLNISENNGRRKEFTKYDDAANIAIYEYRKINEMLSDKPSVEDVAKCIKEDLDKILRYVGKEEIKKFLGE